jgi:hypothetical protein
VATAEASLSALTAANEWLLQARPPDPEDVDTSTVSELQPANVDTIDSVTTGLMAEAGAVMTALPDEAVSH